ncbi:alpha/beta hydrolase [Microvirga sp. BT291]|nr:alpha/beta hydrolase [Microvirga pudoricolor]
MSCYDSDPERTKSQTIVLLHGSGGTAAGTFWMLLPMLARYFRVVTFDFADPIGVDLSLQFYREQAEAVISAVDGDQKVCLLGYSFGAVVAAQLAAQKPLLISSLILVAGWVKTDAQQLLRNDVWRELYESSHPSLGKFSVLMNYGQHFINARTPGELQELIRTHNLGDARSAKMKLNRTVDLSDDLRKIEAPTLVVGCELDQTAPIRHSHMLFGGIEQARLFEIHCGHGVVVERPAELLSVVQDFMSQPDRLPPGSIISNEHA